MNVLYELLDENGARLELRAYPEAVQVGEGAEGEFARMRALTDEEIAELFPPAPPVISSTAFLDRIGADGPALMASPFGFALVRLAAAGTIQLDDPAVVAGMQAAVQANAISAERAAALLAPPA